MEVERAVGLLVEIHPPFYELPDLARSALNDLADGHRVAQEVAGHHCVVDMFLKIVDLEIRHRGHTTLRKSRIGFVESGFAHEGHLAFVRHLEGETHTGNARSYHKEIVFLSHGFQIIGSGAGNAGVVCAWHRHKVNEFRGIDGANFSLTLQSGCVKCGRRE